jgi:hypothetical protein
VRRPMGERLFFMLVQCCIVIMLYVGTTNETECCGTAYIKFMESKSFYRINLY